MYDDSGHNLTFIRQKVFQFSLSQQAPTAHMNLGAILHVIGDLAEAEKSYLEALRLKPDDATTKTNLLKLRQLRANTE